MKNNRLLLFSVLALLALALSACGGKVPTATWPGLAADAKAAYLSNGTVVYAARLTDGEQLWSFPEKPNGKLLFYSNPVFTSDGSLLVGSSGTEHTLFRVDPDTGKETWSFSGAKDHWIASPLVDGDMVYAPNADGTLYVFDMTKDGNDKLAWTLELGGKLWAQPVSDGKNVYVTSLDHVVYVVDPQTHAVRTTVTLGGAILGTPAVSNGRVYVGSLDSAIVAADIGDGSSIAWSTTVKSWLWGGPTLDGDTLYFGDLEGNFYIVNAADGTIKTSFKPDDAILASPIKVGGNLIFVTESGTVYSLEPGGSNPLSLEKLNAKLYTAPVAAGDKILVAPFQGDSLIVALDKDGKQVWSFTPQK